MSEGTRPKVFQFKTATWLFFFSSSTHSHHWYVADHISLQIFYLFFCFSSPSCQSSSLQQLLCKDLLNSFIWSFLPSFTTVAGTSLIFCIQSGVFFKDRTAYCSHLCLQSAQSYRQVRKCEKVLQGTAEVAQPITIYIFMGQGLQEPGMGMIYTTALLLHALTPIYLQLMVSLLSRLSRTTTLMS